MPDWKKCSEEMPPDHEEVLIWEGEYRVVAFHVTRPDKGRWILADSGNYAARVTHWLPLPAPPEEETK